MNGDAVMYDVGKILTVGGATAYKNTPATARAYTIDINNGVTAARTADMAVSRSFANGVALPDGQVLVVGGQATPVPFTDTGARMAPEIWNPATGQWTTLAPMAIPRTYHSVAVLLPDGRVFVGGGGLCGNCTTNHLDGEIFTPPYLLNADGSARTRPTIVTAPATAAAGSTIAVTTGAPVTKFSLMRMSTVTHTVNTDQRRIPLTATSVSGNTASLTLPADRGVLVPGNYLLFAVDGNGVPSVASTINIGSRTASASILRAGDGGQLNHRQCNNSQHRRGIAQALRCHGRRCPGRLLHRGQEPHGDGPGGLDRDRQRALHQQRRTVFAYYRVVGSADPATYTWTLSTAVKWGGGATAYRGVDNTTPLDSAVATAVNTSYTATSIAVAQRDHREQRRDADRRPRLRQLQPGRSRPPAGPNAGKPPAARSPNRPTGPSPPPAPPAPPPGHSAPPKPSQPGGPPSNRAGSRRPPGRRSGRVVHRHPDLRYGAVAVSFTDTSTGGPTSWAWEFGDGGTATTQNPSHTYTAAGTYTARLTATNAGGSTSSTRTITVNPAGPAAPVASFTASPLSGTVPLTVSFTDTSTGGPTSWAWEFGDGGTAATQNASHTYAAAGTYTARLTAADAGGSTSSTRTITVDPGGGTSTGIALRSSRTASTETATTTVQLPAPASQAAGDVAGGILHRR